MTPLQRAVFAGLIAAGLAATLHALSVAPARLIVTVVGALLLVWVLPRLLLWGTDKLGDGARAAIWRDRQGRHHSVAGVALDIADDGRHVWVAAAGVRTALHSRDSDDVLAARHSGRWRRSDQGRLWLRADAVVAYLGSAPGRLDPHTIRLRRYLQEQVLFPVAERRRRAQHPGQGRA